MSMVGKRVLIVSTSHKALGDTDQSTGVYLEELAVPYYYFKERMLKPVIASVKGGEIPIDPKSVTGSSLSKLCQQFQSDEDAQTSVKASVPLASVNVNDYVAIYFPGGHGTCWDFTDRVVISTVEAFNNNNKVIGAVCHGPVALINPTRSDGKPLVQGRNISAFTNDEERAVGLDKTVPFLLEDELKRNGCHFTKADNWTAHAIRDGNLITGQNPASAECVAKLMCEALDITH